VLGIQEGSIRFQPREICQGLFFVMKLDNSYKASRHEQPVSPASLREFFPDVSEIVSFVPGSTPLNEPCSETYSNPKPTLGKFDIYISALVMQEASRGDSVVVEKRLSVVSDIPILEITPEVLSLAQFLISEKAIPAESEEDALHIAVARINGMEFLLTWNFSHINNAFMKSKIVNVIENQGYVPPEICSPEELVGD